MRLARLWTGVLAATVAAGLLGAAGCSSTPAALSPDEIRHLDLQVEGAKHDFVAAKPSLKTYFDTSYGYAVFPRITSGAFILGGARGHGLVYEKGAKVGSADVTVVNVGAQIGGKRFSEVVFFENQGALAAFKAGTLEFDARASAVAAGSGSGSAVDYVNGVRVFTQEEGGLMLEAAIGGQKFRFLPMTN